MGRGRKHCKMDLFTLVNFLTVSIRERAKWFTGLRVWPLDTYLKVSGLKARGKAKGL